MCHDRAVSPRYVRYESAVPNPHGRHPGIFAMLTGLRKAGRLSDQDEVLATELVRRSYALHTEPPAEVFDTYPRAISWFLAQDSPEASALEELAADVRELLGRYGIRCREVHCDQLGTITYADAVQVVAIPATAAQWPL